MRISSKLDLECLVYDYAIRSNGSGIEYFALISNPLFL